MNSLAEESSVSFSTPQCVRGCFEHCKRPSGLCNGADRLRTLTADSNNYYSLNMRSLYGHLCTVIIVSACVCKCSYGRRHYTRSIRSSTYVQHVVAYRFLRSILNEILWNFQLSVLFNRPIFRFNFSLGQIPPPPKTSKGEPLGIAEAA